MHPIQREKGEVTKKPGIKAVPVLVGSAFY